MRLESFEAGKLQEISDIRGGKPVLLGVRHLHPDPLGKGDERFPKLVISYYQHASMPLAKRPQISQGLKHIHRIADVVKEDVIEFFIWLESLLKLLLVWESYGEFEGGLRCCAISIISEQMSMPLPLLGWRTPKRLPVPQRTERTLFCGSTKNRRSRSSSS